MDSWLPNQLPDGVPWNPYLVYLYLDRVAFTETEFIQGYYRSARRQHCESLNDVIASEEADNPLRLLTEFWL